MRARRKIVFGSLWNNFSGKECGMMVKKSMSSVIAKINVFNIFIHCEMSLCISRKVYFSWNCPKWIKYVAYDKLRGLLNRTLVL